MRFYTAEGGAVAEAGPLFWVHLIYTDVLLWAGTVVPVLRSARLSRLYRRQSIILLISVMLPWGANLLFNLRVSPFGLIDLSPFAFTVTAGVLVFGVFRFGLLDQRPMARSQIFDTIGDPVLVLDPYGRVIDANPAAGRLVGLAVPAVIGKSALRLLPALGERALGQVTASEISLAGRTYDLAVAPLPGRPGRRGGQLLVARDITERRLAEQALHSALDRERVASEQLGIALARERAATEHLRGLDDLKSAFLQAVSHDLPSRQGHRRAAAGADRPRRAGGRRGRSGAGRPRRRPPGVHRPAAGEIAIDSAKVERIVENLLVNASRHTPPGTPTWVSVDRRDAGAMLTVADAGPGVPADQRERIFQPFHRGPGETSHAPGSGVGLALVARFADLHGGRAWVEPRAGGGASFRVLLPDSPDATPPAEPMQRVMQ